jgi:small-conductance mechanosensitive channel
VFEKWPADLLTSADSLLRNGDAWIWAVAVAIGFPAVSVTLAEFVLRFRRNGHALARPLEAVRHLILPTVAALVLLTRVIGWNSATTAVKLLETVLWVFVIHAALSFLNAVLFAHAREGTWQAKMPTLFIEMSRGIIVIVCLAIVISVVWGQDLGKVVTALGVGSLVLGLALQEPLGNLFSGIVLMLEQPIGIGDWVKVGDSLGTVVESNWRATHLKTRDNDMVVVPNSVLAKGSFVNYSRPTTLHSESVTINFSCDDAPNKVKVLLLEAARRTQGVSAKPGPKVRLAAFRDSSIEYEVKLPTTEFDRIKDIAEEFRTLVWYASRREGLTMPYPISTQISVAGPVPETREYTPLAHETLQAFPHLGLTDPDLSETVSRGSLRHYARGEQVVKEGQRLSGLHLIVKGQVSRSVRNDRGVEIETARLERGDFFGEKSLLASAPSDVTITALEDLELLVLEGDVVRSLIEQAPYLSHQIEVMEARHRVLEKAAAAGRPGV